LLVVYKETFRVAASGYDAPSPQQRYGSEIVEEENEKMADVLADKVKALKSVSYESLTYE